MMLWPNMLLIAGTDRNVGKTTLICKVIKNVSKNTPVVAIKITPHIHELCNSCIPLFQSESLIIAEETSSILLKDSSKMLAAGAKKVFYVQGADNQLEKVIEFLKPLIPGDTAIVCESAALRNFIQPGIFVLMSINKNAEIVKNTDKVSLADIQLFDYEYSTEDYKFEDGEWKLLQKL